MYVLNNCYLDSILVALFKPTDSTVLDNFFFSRLRMNDSGTLLACGESVHDDFVNRSRIQQMLYEIVRKIRGGGEGFTGERFSSCELREALFRFCPNADYNMSNLKEPKDVVEFIGHLLSIFPVTGEKIVKELIIKTETITNDEGNIVMDDRVEKKRENTIHDITMNVDVDKLEGKTTYLSNHIEKKYTSENTTSSPYQKKSITSYVEETFNYHSLSCFIFTVPTVMSDNHRGRKTARLAIIPDSNITKDGITFVLSGIICALPGHFVAYYREEDTWYFYDDMQSTLKLNVGSYAQLMVHEKSRIQKKGVVFLYIRRDTRKNVRMLRLTNPQIRQINYELQDEENDDLARVFMDGFSGGFYKMP